MTNGQAEVPAHLLQRIERLRVRHLKLLQLVASTGSLTAAAQVLRISQPSATKMLQELEHAFGATLVERNARGGSLSKAGVRALERLCVATGAIEAVVRTLQEAPETPLVRIGMLPIAGVALIPQLVARLSQQASLPRLQLREAPVASVLQMLSRGEIDCVIGRVGDVQGDDVARFDTLPLSDDRFEVACAPDHPLAQARRLGLRQLRDAAWIVPAQGSYTRQVFDAAFVSEGLTPPVPAMESPSFHTRLETAASSGLLAFAPSTAVQMYARYGRVHRVSLAQPFQTDKLVFLTLRSVENLPAVALVRATLAQIAA